MYLPKIREIQEALNSFFSAPYTSKFPKEKFEAALQYRGKPRYNKDYCIGCGTCAQVCTAKAIEVIDDHVNKIRTFKIDYCSCINCGQCEEHCITEKGIKLTNEHSFATMNKSAPENFEILNRDLAICECCGEVIACCEHLLWIKERIGAKAYANPNLMLEMQRKFFDVDKSLAKSRIRREDYIKEVCPKCRHKIVVADEF